VSDSFTIPYLRPLYMNSCFSMNSNTSSWGTSVPSSRVHMISTLTLNSSRVCSSGCSVLSAFTVTWLRRDKRRCSVFRTRVLASLVTGDSDSERVSVGDCMVMIRLCECIGVVLPHSSTRLCACDV